MRNRSCPAVSQTVSLIRLLLSSRCFTLKSTPMVDWICSSNASSVKRMSMEDCWYDVMWYLRFDVSFFAITVGSSNFVENSVSAEDHMRYERCVWCVIVFICQEIHGGEERKMTRYVIRVTSFK